MPARCNDRVAVQEMQLFQAREAEAAAVTQTDNVRREIRALKELSVLPKRMPVPCTAWAWGGTWECNRG